MKKVIFILAIAFASCTSKKPAVTQPVDSSVNALAADTGNNILNATIIRVDTIYVKDTVLQRKADSLLRRTITYDFTMKQIKRYCDIVGRNPSQIKYLRGWVLRAIDIK